MRPLIVLTTTTYAAAEYRVPQVMLGSPYVQAIESFGATSLLLTPAHHRESIDRILGLAHGLVLTGGEDVDPARYGQQPHPQLGMLNPQRDAMELAAVEAALARRLPVLAICRGFQLLNVAFGGTLYQDLPSQREGRVVHEQSAPIGHRWHGARVEPGSRLEEILGEPELSINSFHHQGIDRLGEGLRPLVWAEDGLVEGVEAVDYPWVFGVQWHPERGEADAPGDPLHPDRRLFDAFVAAAREYAGGVRKSESASLRA